VKIPIHLLRSIWIEGKRCEKGTTADVEIPTLGTLLLFGNAHLPFELVAKSVSDLQSLDEAIEAASQQFSGFEAFPAHRAADFVHRQLMNARVLEKETRTPSQSTHQNVRGK
jgi:hypothetical protein